MTTPPHATPATEADPAFAETVRVARGLSLEAHALAAGDLGDAIYRVDSFTESLDLMRRVEASQQAATLVVMDLKTPEATDPLLAFNARVARVDDDQQSLELDLPLGSAPVARGLTLRGSVRLDGVTVTFECETLGTETSPDARAPVLRARLPFRLYRLQRRDSFRVPVSTSAGVFVSLRPGVRGLEELRALDLSCGGVSLVVCAPLEAVHQGKRFPQATVRLYANPGSQLYTVDMLVRHVRLMPPGLSQLLGASMAGGGSGGMAGDGAAAAPASRPQGKATGGVFRAPARTQRMDAAHRQADAFRQQALAAMGAAPKPEWVQLGIEFERMPTALERELAKRVNELAVNLVSGH